MNYYRIGDSINLGSRYLPGVLKVGYNGNVEDTLLLLSEDTSTKTLTYYNYNWPGFAFLYGDSITLNLGLNTGDSSSYCCMRDTIYYILDSTSYYTDLTSSVRKQYHFHTSAPKSQYTIPQYFSWTEGLGATGRGYSSFAFFFPPWHCHSDPPGLEIICISEADGSPIYRNPDYNTCQPLNTENPEFEKLEVFPNPASDYLRLRNSSRITELNILDMTGQVIKNRSYKDGEYSIEISLKSLIPGIYIVQLTSEKSSASKRVIIQR